MKWKEWLDQWNMTGLSINAGFLNMEWKPGDRDRDAAWELYIELLTRLTTRYLQPDHGKEKTALDSIHALFGLTQETLKRHGRHAEEFAKIAIVVLNQVVRPFTAKWHREALAGCFDDAARCGAFRDELTQLQKQLRQYTRMLADIAGVEDLTSLQTADGNRPAALPGPT